MLWVLRCPDRPGPEARGTLVHGAISLLANSSSPSSHRSRRKPELKGREGRDAHVAMATGMQESLRTVSLLLPCPRASMFLLAPGVGAQSKE